MLNMTLKLRRFCSGQRSKDSSVPLLRHRIMKLLSERSTGVLCSRVRRNIKGTQIMKRHTGRLCCAHLTSLRKDHVLGHDSKGDFGSRDHGLGRAGLETTLIARGKSHAKTPRIRFTRFNNSQFTFHGSSCWTASCWLMPHANYICPSLR